MKTFSKLSLMLCTLFLMNTVYAEKLTYGVLMKTLSKEILILQTFSPRKLSRVVYKNVIIEMHSIISDAKQWLY